MDFSRVLRERRIERRISQLEMASRAGTTQRHLSFIESGRSVPGRGMVLRLAETLNLSLRERNEWLLAAGYAPAYPQTPLDDAALAPVRAALGHVLDGHRPYPALIVDRTGAMIGANDAFDVITQGASADLIGPGRNMYRLALHPDGIAPRIRNLAEWGRHILGRLDRAEELRDELRGYVPELEPSSGRLGFAVPLHLDSTFGRLRLMTTVMTFATATDITLTELKLEAFLPADSFTAEALHVAAAG
ncbi:helix-turn-helix domain-containing protein [Actinoplanes couchii]|uniref:XRE family transcriptional regulator n=1 Tax=Actinoplanes couchii TaxID=403638 RepID=A0ABQ3XNC2_9ACTN|nr:helix-turn-helix domain-containing protein [Actinoplanes couchii]MDR6318152.1 transcriptional regulator with XRE-family HTH domain [Actinoplanes couchii]GID59932.1 XRE family transcriptional regulator [Actinoplanes couchii]